MNLVLALFSLAISFQWSMLSALLLPADILRFVPASEKVLHLGWVVGLVLWWPWLANPGPGSGATVVRDAGGAAGR